MRRCAHPRPPHARAHAHARAQGKFNLDVAEVEVALGHHLLQHSRPAEAQRAALTAYGIVIEVLGDGTLQVRRTCRQMPPQKGDRVCAQGWWLHARTAGGGARRPVGP